MGSLIFAVVVLTIVVMFSVQNAGPVAVSFLAWHFEASLAIVIALSLLSGLILGVVALSWIRLRQSLQKKKSAVSEPAPGGKSKD